MMTCFSTRRGFFQAFLTSILISRAAAKLISGCDEVGCPFENRMPICPIGNITATEIGVVNFTTPQFPVPFTWTTTVSLTSRNSSTGGGYVVERGYIFGAPPGVDLTSIQNTTGCALIFNEISPNFTFPGNYSYETQGTCEDAMGLSCPQALQSQALAALALLSSNGTKVGSTLCNELASVLRDNPPSSCNVTAGGTWGTIHAREILGSGIPRPLNASNCPGTTGKNYSLRLVDTYDTITDNYAANIEAPMLGVTPVLTAFIPQALTRRTNGRNTVADLNISCLKPIYGQGQAFPAQGKATATSAWYSNFALVLITLGVAGLGSAF